MKSFSQLLTAHIQRDGISDTELARAVGVRRQTIFRWKEGIVARPRHREDVLAIAGKLRLTPAERDELLIAAGFRPEQLPAPLAEKTPDPPAPQPPIPTSETVSAPQGPGRDPSTAEPPASQPAPAPERRPWRLWAGAGLVLLLAVTVAAFLWDRNRIPVAQPGETLVVVARFTNFAGADVGFNVAGRIAERLAAEVAAAGLPNARVASWPRAIPNTAAAQAALAQSGAQLIVWGEYDSGRVLARLLSTGLPEASLSQFEAQLASPAELSATINSTVPREVRYVALLALGQLYTSANQTANARSVLEQALAAPPDEPDARATLHFRLGLAYQLGEAPQREKAIEQYGLALEQEPGHLSARYNRGLAFLYRGKAGDLDRALVDFSGVLAQNGGYVPALIGRGVAHFFRGEEGPAIADFSRAIALDDSRHLAYYNRGLLAIRQDDRAGWEADLLRAVELAPDFADGHAALCWGYVLANEPDTALEICDRAIRLGAAPALDSRAIAHLLRGEEALARADFEAFLAWLADQPDSSPYQPLAARVRGWLAALDAGRNPVTPEVLEGLRLE